MADHERNKRLVAAFAADVAAAPAADVRSVLSRYCADDVVWKVFHPFNTLSGVTEAAESFWGPLKDALPNYEQRLNVILAGEYEEREWVSTLGHVMGAFERPWVGIPPTQGLVFLRIGMNLLLEEGQITQAFVLLDVVDVMRQAGCYPFRQMPGSAEQWPAPPCTAVSDPYRHDPELGAKTLSATLEMLSELYSGEHSRHWHPDMNWYGPAGIGSTRGARGFYDYHCALWRQGFPDDVLFERPADASVDDVGPYILTGDGHFSVYAGWANQHGKHLGGGLFGLAPTGRHVKVRVADWYRTDDSGRIIDNWVMIDVLDMLAQMDYDVLADMRYLVDPTLPRRRHVADALGRKFAYTGSKGDAPARESTAQRSGASD